MNLNHRELMGLAFLIPMYAAATVNAQTITVLTEPRARSVVVLRIEVNELSDDRAVYLELKGPNDDGYRELYLFSSDDGGIYGTQFGVSANSKRLLIVPVFVSGVKDLGLAKHVFDSSGVYSLRLKSYYYDTPGAAAKERILFERQVEFGEPTEADLQYFARARQENIAEIFGIAPEYAKELASINADIPGLIVAAACAQSTRHRVDPPGGNAELGKWAESMYDLAFAVPDSSYAPYIAYFAAYCLLEPKNDSYLEKTYGFTLPNKRIAEVEFHKKASKALAFTIERGDPYIKPFAMCYLSALKARSGDFTGAHELIQRLKKEANMPKQAAKLLDQFERYTEELRRKAGK